MKKPKYVPGPWEVYKRIGRNPKFYDWTIKTNKAGIFANVFFLENFNKLTIKDSKISEATAKLIAEAPTLLRLLKHAEEYIDHADTDENQVQASLAKEISETISRIENSK